MQNMEKHCPIIFNRQSCDSNTIDCEGYDHENYKADILPWFSSEEVEAVLNSEEPLVNSFDEYVNNFSAYALFPHRLLPPLPVNALDYYTSQSNFCFQCLPSYNLNREDLFMYSSTSYPCPHEGNNPNC